MLELPLVNRATRLSALDAPQVLLDRHSKQKAMHLRIVETTDEVRQLQFSPPDVFDDEVSVAEAPVVPYKQLDGRVQVFELGVRRRVDGHQGIAAEHRAR